MRESENVSFFLVINNLVFALEEPKKLNQALCSGLNYIGLSDALLRKFQIKSLPGKRKIIPSVLSLIDSSVKVEATGFY